jgi:hypothetical protein
MRRNEGEYPGMIERPSDSRHHPDLDAHIIAIAHNNIAIFA